ncbi:MAG TPA: ABC transporter substrate-binding protein [Solirubrobacterales bacterium]|nr:ABC transporter substrate-binding protein [Solirubrobacterales bacterium]
MKRVVALLATVIVTSALAACGGGGAEPGARDRATLVLDFQPNAVHAGIYAAVREGYYQDAGVDLQVREPSASTDAPKLLIAGRAQFAILDIHDLGLARERHLKLVGVMPIVQRPLAAVIAADRAEVRRPSDLAGATVGVTGLPSDDAVLDSVLQAGGLDPAGVRRVTIGFQAVSSLAAGKVDAATAFWNAEGVTLQRQGIPIREFRVDDYGAPRYPELVLATGGRLLSQQPSLVRRVVGATARGYALAVSDPSRALDDLLAADPALDRDEEAAELRALEGANAFEPVARFNRAALAAWARWDVRHGILERRPDVRSAFPIQASSSVSAAR